MSGGGPGEIGGALGTASDLEDGPLHGERLTWTSDRDGVLGKGRRVDVPRLSPGLHRIAFAATDSAGATAEMTIELVVGEAAPGGVFLCADVNGDGVANIADAVGVLDYSSSPAGLRRASRPPTPTTTAR